MQAFTRIIIMAPQSGPITVRVTRSVAVIVSIIIIIKQKRSASAGFKNVFITEKLSYFILITYEKSLIKKQLFLPEICTSIMPSS